MSRSAVHLLLVAFLCGPACGDDELDAEDSSAEGDGDGDGDGPDYPEPGEEIWTVDELHTLLATARDGRVAILRAGDAVPPAFDADAVWLDPATGDVAETFLDWSPPDGYEPERRPGRIVEPNDLLLPLTDAEDVDAAWLGRLDPAGAVLHETRLLDTAAAEKVLPMPDGDVLLVARNDEGRKVLGRIGADGAILWQRDMSTGVGGEVTVNDVAVDTNGAIVGVGRTDMGGSVPRVIELDPGTGETIAEQIINAEVTLERVALSAGDLYVGGFSAISTLEPRTPILLRINPDGVIVWTEPTGPAIGPNELLHEYSLTVTPDPVGVGACMTSYVPTIVGGVVESATGSAVCVADDREVVWSHVVTEPGDPLALSTWTDGDGDLYVQFGFISSENRPVGTRIQKLGNPFR